MSECESCKNKKNYPCPNSCGYMGVCDGFEPKPITNAERIRAMSDEELAEYLDGVCHDLWQMFVKDPKKMWLDWLRQEAQDA